MVGTGFTSVEAFLAWTVEDGLPFELWTDSSRVLASTYGAVESEAQELPDRIAVLLGTEGEVRLEYRDDPKGGVDPSEILADLYVLYE